MESTRRNEEYRQDFLILLESIACVQGTRRFADKHINLPTRELFSCRKFQGIDGFANEIANSIPLDMDKRFEQKRKEFLFTFGCDRVLHPAELPRSQTHQGPGCGRSRKYTSQQRFLHPGVPFIQRGPEDLRKSKKYRITREQNVIDVAHDASEHLPHKKHFASARSTFLILLSIFHLSKTLFNEKGHAQAGRRETSRSLSPSRRPNVSSPLREVETSSSSLRLPCTTRINATESCITRLRSLATLRHRGLLTFSTKSSVNRRSRWRNWMPIQMD